MQSCAYNSKFAYGSNAQGLNGYRGDLNNFFGIQMSGTYPEYYLNSGLVLNNRNFNEANK